MRRRLPFTWRLVIALAGAALVLAGGSLGAHSKTPARAPRLLSETGLLGAGGIAYGAVAYSPNYPLWSDHAAKRRWVRLPPGTFIDASDPARFAFPAGTRFWKEFSHGRPVETRMLEALPGGRFRYASYRWRADGRDADLVPEEGGRADLGASGPYEFPSVADCKACHEAGRSAVLGFEALQLSPERDPLAPHAEAASGEDLRTLVASGLLRRLPHALLEAPPRAPGRTPLERAALGYLHGNCGHCHASEGALARLGLVLANDLAAPAGSAPALLTTVGVAPLQRLAGVTARVSPGSPRESALWARMSTRHFTQMPPLGTHIADADAVALVGAWIESLAVQPAVQPAVQTGERQ